jgi:hypothetical protein
MTVAGVGRVDSGGERAGRRRRDRHGPVLDAPVGVVAADDARAIAGDRTKASGGDCGNRRRDGRRDNATFRSAHRSDLSGSRRGRRLPVASI